MQPEFRIYGQKAKLVLTMDDGVDIEVLDAFELDAGGIIVDRHRVSAAMAAYKHDHGVPEPAPYQIIG